MVHEPLDLIRTNNTPLRPSLLVKPAQRLTLHVEPEHPGPPNLPPPGEEVCRGDGLGVEPLVVGACGVRVPLGVELGLCVRDEDVRRVVVLGIVSNTTFILG